MLADMPYYDYDDEESNPNFPKNEVFLSQFDSPDDLKKYIDKLNDV